MPISLPSSAAPPPATLGAATALLASGIDWRLELNDSYVLPLAVLFNDVPATPTSLALRLRDPTGATSQYTLAAGAILALAAGRFGFPFAASLVGRWAYTWIATFPGFTGSFTQTCRGELVVYRNLSS